MASLLHRSAAVIPTFSINLRNPAARVSLVVASASTSSNSSGISIKSSSISSPSPSSPSLSIEQPSLALVSSRPSLASSSSSLVLAPSNFVGEFYRLSIADQLFVVLGVLSCLTVGALLTALVAAIPTLKAIHRASLSLEKLSDMAREELPGTMAAIRLSSMEISDLTLELNDLRQVSHETPSDLIDTSSFLARSQEITDGVRSSARAVQAAEVGIRRMGAVAASQVFAMLQERATVPVEAVKPVVANAAETTRQAMLQAQRAVLTLASHPQLSRWFWKRIDEEVSQEEQLQQQQQQQQEL